MSPVKDPVAYGTDWPEVSTYIRYHRSGGRCECRGECATRGARRRACLGEYAPRGTCTRCGRVEISWGPR